jgi:hypothetical protein
MPAFGVAVARVTPFVHAAQKGGYNPDSDLQCLV